MLPFVATISVELCSFTYNQAGGDEGVIQLHEVSGEKWKQQGHREGIDLQLEEEGDCCHWMYSRPPGITTPQQSQEELLMLSMISMIKVQIELWVMDDPTNPQLCAFYDTENSFANLVSPTSFRFTDLDPKCHFRYCHNCQCSMFLLCVVVTCIILYLCGVLQCFKRGKTGSCSQVYVPIK